MNAVVVHSDTSLFLYQQLRTFNSQTLQACICDFVAGAEVKPGDRWTFNNQTLQACICDFVAGAEVKPGDRWTCSQTLQACICDLITHIKIQCCEIWASGNYHSQLCIFNLA
jgi:hypothetical protein